MKTEQVSRTAAWIAFPLLAIATQKSCTEAFIPRYAVSVVKHDGKATAISLSTLRTRQQTCLQSSIGGGGGGSGGGVPPPEGEGNSQWDDFFREESENLRRAREFMSENALPLNYDLDNDDDAKDSSNKDKDLSSSSSSSLVRRSDFFQDGGSSALSAEALANNPYLQVVSKLSPSEMIAKFTSTAHPRVQNAVRSTILSLIGGLPKMAFDTTTITTGQRLASLMFQLQVSQLFALNVLALVRLIVQGNSRCVLNTARSRFCYR